MSAQKNLGGGVLLELSHEIDYMIWFLGSPILLEAKLFHSKDLKTNVETGANIKMSFKNNISVKMELDFHSQDVNKEIL